METTYRRASRVLFWVGIPLAIHLLLEVFWPGETPLWLSMISLPLVLVGVPTLAVMFVSGSVLVFRHYRAKRSA